MHCQRGGRSAVASAFLAAQNRRVVYASGEWTEWEKSGMPVERFTSGQAAPAGVGAR